MTERQLLRVLAWLVIGIAVAPAVLIVVETASFYVGHPWVVAIWERVVGPICHHWDWRTLHLDGRPYPVCARCTGMYLGYVAGLPMVAMLGPVARRPVWIGRLMVGFAVVWGVGFVAGLGELVDLWRTVNATRVGLGAALGWPAAATLALWTRTLVQLAAERAAAPVAGDAASTIVTVPR